MALLSLYQSAAAAHTAHEPFQYSAGWAPKDANAYNVITMCNNDTRNFNSSVFQMHIPVDNVIINVLNRNEDVLSSSEYAAAKSAGLIINLMPIYTFMIIARVSHMYLYRLPQLGEAYFDIQKNYWELSLEVGNFAAFAEMFANLTDNNYITVLAHIMPAFIFGNDALEMDIWSKTRIDKTIHDGWRPNQDVSERDLKWFCNNSASIQQIAQRTHYIDDIRSALFARLEENISDALEVYEKYVNNKGKLHELEIEDDERKYDTSGQIPEWWPTRLIDVRMNALLPGKNVWYYRGYFVTLSYTWETGNFLIDNHRPMFSAKTLKTYIRYSYDRLLNIAQNVDPSGYLWIDALCINQENATEILQEVARSPKYYRYCNKCIVMPAGLSNIISVNDLSGTSLPRWFSRAWTLQEAASAQFIVGVFAEGYLDRFEILKYLDENFNHSGVILSSARSIMRRTALSMLEPAEIFEWALARDAFKREDIIYGIISLLLPNIVGNVPIVYELDLESVILKTAEALSGSSRTSLLTLAGQGWLPTSVDGEDLVGITVTSTLDSIVLENKDLLIKSTELIKANSVKKFKKLLQHNAADVRYSNKSGIRKHVENACISHTHDKNGPAEDEVIRAWVAVVYMSSDIIYVKHDKGELIGRSIIMYKHFTHLIFIGYSKQSVYLEKVYVCAVHDGNSFHKAGIIAVPVGTYNNEQTATSDVIISK